MRNLLSYVPKGKKELVAATVRTVFAQPTQEDATRKWRIVADTLRPAFPKVSAIMDEAENDALAFMGFPEELWSMTASTNGLERLNRELKRRSDVVQILPERQIRRPAPRSRPHGTARRMAGHSNIERVFDGFRRAAA